MDPALQKTTIKDHLASTSLTVGESHYLVCNKWWSSWKGEPAPPVQPYVLLQLSCYLCHLAEYTQYDQDTAAAASEPGPIDNSLLCSEGSVDVLRSAICTDPRQLLLTRLLLSGGACNRDLISSTSLSQPGSSCTSGMAAGPCSSGRYVRGAV